MIALAVVLVVVSMCARMAGLGWVIFAVYVIIMIAEFVYPGVSPVYLIAGQLIFLKDFSYISVVVGGVPLYVTEYVIAVFIIRYILYVAAGVARPALRMRHVYIIAIMLVYGAIQAAFGYLAYGIMAIRHSAVIYYIVIAVMAAETIRTQKAIERALCLIFTCCVIGQLLQMIYQYHSITMEYIYVGSVYLNVIAVPACYYYLSKRKESLPLLGYILLLIVMMHAMAFVKVSIIVAYVVMALFYVVVRKYLGRRVFLIDSQGIKRLLLASTTVLLAFITVVVFQVGWVYRLSSELTLLAKPVQIWTSLFADVKNEGISAFEGEEAETNRAAGKQGDEQQAAPGDSQGKGIDRDNSEEDSVLKIDRFLRKTSPRGQMNNVHWRWLVWKEALRQTASNPLLGIGFGPAFTANEVKEYGYVWAPDLNPHNSFILVLLRTGMIGALLFVLLHFVVIKKVVAGMRRVDKEVANLYLTILFSFLGIVIAAMFNVVLESPFGAVPYWFLFGLLITCGRLAERHQGSDKTGQALR